MVLPQCHPCCSPPNHCAESHVHCSLDFHFICSFVFSILRLANMATTLVYGVHCMRGTSLSTLYPKSHLGSIPTESILYAHFQMGKLREVGWLIQGHLARIDEVGLDPSLSDGRAHAAGLYTTPLSEPQASEGSLPRVLCASNTEIRQLLGARTLEGHDT